MFVSYWTVYLKHSCSSLCTMSLPLRMWPSSSSVSQDMMSEPVYVPDDTVSASSNMDMEDRVSHLEQRLQLQEDEIQLLKSALADALRRLGYCEEQSLATQAGAVHAAGRRPLSTTASAPPTKGRSSIICAQNHFPAGIVPSAALER